MSLICWLPLNQDLHNQGISNLVKANVSAATVLENNGKIGKCYTNTGTTASVATPLILNTIAFSACAWVRINTSRTNWCRAFGMGGTNTYFGLGCEHSNGTLLGFHFYKTIDGTNTSIFDNYPTSKQVGTWVHYAMTYDGEKAYLYENGNLLNTLTVAAARQNTRCEMTNLYLFGGTSGNYSQCSLNDVRIYDNCLSAAEVKEIAQGLVLHYKLDNNGQGGRNLAPNSSNFSGWSAGAGWTKLEENGSTVYHYERTGATSNAWKRLIPNLHIIPDEHPNGITVSLDFKCDDMSVLNQKTIGALQIYRDDNVRVGWYEAQWDLSNCVSGQWQRISRTYTQTQLKTNNHSSYPNATIAYTTVSFQLVQNGSIYIKHIKIEDGDIATAYSLAPEDYGDDSNIVEDSSGYGHNGSILNDVLISSDTPRYSTSTNLVAGNSAINCGRGGMVTDSITVNLWIKSSAWANPVSCTEGGGWNFETNGNGFRFPVYLSGVGYKATGATTTTRAQICNNQWHMITGVYDRLNQKIRVYIDANLEYEENTSSSALIGYHGSNVIWIGAEASGSATAIGSNGMAGLFSDFRIYCTPLLDTDIKQLYNVGMKVDKGQNIHVFELNEQKEKNSLSKQGQLFSKEFEENTKASLYKTNIIEANEFIER